jgi:hypothetical protein
LSFGKKATLIEQLWSRLLELLGLAIGFPSVLVSFLFFFGFDVTSMNMMIWGILGSLITCRKTNFLLWWIGKIVLFLSKF